MRTGICEVASMHVHTGWDEHGKQEGEPLRSQRMWKNHLGHVLQKSLEKSLCGVLVGSAWPSSGPGQGHHVRTVSMIHPQIFLVVCPTAPPYHWRPMLSAVSAKSFLESPGKSGSSVRVRATTASDKPNSITGPPSPVALRPFCWASVPFPGRSWQPERIRERQLQLTAAIKPLVLQQLFDHPACCRPGCRESVVFQVQLSFGSLLLSVSHLATDDMWSQGLRLRAGSKWNLQEVAGAVQRKPACVSFA